MIVSRAYIASGEVDEKWPFTLPVVSHVVRNDLTFTNAATFFVGENGSGKSTLIEALAEAYGFDIRGGHAGRRYNNAPQKSRLGESMRLDRTSSGRRMTRRAARGFFLRAESSQGVFEFMSEYGVSGYGEKHLGRVSHGEGFLQVAANRFTTPGLYLMDEPEAALSFTSCLRFMQIMADVVSHGGQIICATHSPLLCALPRAQILELREDGIANTSWEDLDLVKYWRSFLNRPERWMNEL